MSRAHEIVTFWFGTPDDPEWGEMRPWWFQADAVMDAEIERRFRSVFEEAAAGGLAEWEESPEECLALILLLDQCSNTLHRGDARAFATDERGRDVARRAIERGFDQQFPEIHRWFFYLPLEHSEDLADQALSVKLFGQLEPTELNRMGLDYAVRHQRVIQRFGRFPNRNAALGRESTPEELEFLAGPDAPF